MSIGERTSPKADSAEAATAKDGAVVDPHTRQSAHQSSKCTATVTAGGPAVVITAALPNKENAQIDLKNPEMDLLTMAQREELERRIVQANPELVNSHTELITSLRFEFVNDARYLNKVDELATKYTELRRVRPDGNCFFRSLAFSYCQRLIEPHMRSEWLRFRKVVTDMRSKMIDELKFPAFTVQDFYESFMEFLDKCHPLPHSADSQDSATTVSPADECMSPDELMMLFNDQPTSDYIVVFLRLITSAYMQLNADFYACFIEDDVSVAQFCARHVEPMYQESDHVHISALTQATGIAVQIMYLDRGNQTEASAIRFPEDKEPLIHLLYRPGHYEIIYPVRPE